MMLPPGSAAAMGNNPLMAFVGAQAGGPPTGEMPPMGVPPMGMPYQAPLGVPAPVMPVVTGVPMETNQAAIVPTTASAENVDAGKNT